MPRVIIRIAELNIGVTCLTENFVSFCRDYIVSDCETDFDVSITEDDVKFEKQKTAEELIYEGKKATNVSSVEAEKIAIYRKIADKLPDYDAFVFHGSALSAAGKAVIFTAKSGTGKTTHSNLWIKNFDDTFFINGDKPIIRIIDGLPYVFGTPWSGKEGLNRNTYAQISEIVVLERGINNSIEAISFDDAFPLLIQQSHRPDERLKLIKIIEILKRAGEKINFLQLKCNMNNDAAIVCRDKISQLRK